MISIRARRRVPCSRRRHNKRQPVLHVLPTPPAAAHSSLPYDILAQIFGEYQPRYDNGAWDKSLSSFADFATVNSDVCSIIAGGLYRHVVFEGMGLFGDDYLQRSEKCCNALQGNPTLAARVQSCSIVYLMADTDEDPDVELLADTLRLMTNIRSLELKDLSLPLPLLQAICSLESLESLSLKNCDLPNAPIPASCFKLSNITALDSGPVSVSALINAPHQLRSLIMDAESTAQAINAVPWASLTSLTQLYAEPSHTTAPGFNSLLPSLPSLRDVGFCHPCTSAPYTVSDFNLPSASLPLLERYMGPSTLTQAFIPGRPVHTIILDQQQDSGGIRPRNLRSASLPFPIQESMVSVPATELEELDVVVGELDMPKWRAMGKFSRLGKLRVTCLDSTPSLVSIPLVFLSAFTNIYHRRLCTHSSIHPPRCIPSKSSHQLIHLHPSHSHNNILSSTHFTRHSPPSNRSPFFPGSHGTTPRNREAGVQLSNEQNLAPHGSRSASGPPQQPGSARTKIATRMQTHAQGLIWMGILPSSLQQRGARWTRR